MDFGFRASSLAQLGGFRISVTGLSCLRASLEETVPCGKPQKPKKQVNNTYRKLFARRVKEVMSTT